MNTRLAKYWWIGPLGVFLLIYLTPIACQLKPNTALAPIPVGSRLSELDKHLGKFYDDSTVQEWLPNGDKIGPAHVTTKYGSFNVRDLGAYDNWKASTSEPDAFTGELTFYHHSSVIPDDLAPSYVFRLVYVKGVLKEKDYGHLPG